MRKKVELTENAEMLVDANIQMPNAAKNVLGALIYTRGAYTDHRKENNDWFYRDADSLIEESQVSKKTFFRMINLLEANNFIERQSGSLKKGGNKVTQYKILKGVNNLSIDTLEVTDNEDVKNNDTLIDTLNDTLNDTQELRNKNKEKRIKHIELNKELDLNKDLFILNKILDNIYYNKYNNIKLNIIKKEKYIKEKENNSSTFENKEIKEIETMRELKEQVNTLQEENAKLTSRLDNCARQFKEMLKTMKQLQARVDYLESKQSSTNDNQQPSTTVEEERKDCAEKKEDVSSPTASDNGTTLTTIHQEEEKPTVAQQMPVGKKLRYIDTMTDKHYATEAEAQQDCVDPKFLYDSKVGRCLTSYTSSLSPSNDPSGVTVQDKQENASEGKEMPLNERESFLLTVAQVFDDLRKRKYLNYQDKTDQLKEVWNYIMSKEDILKQSDLEVCQKELKEILSQAIVASY